MYMYVSLLMMLLYSFYYEIFSLSLSLSLSLLSSPLQGNTTILDSHMLLVTIPGGLPPSMAPTDGNRSLIDLSNFPRLRLGGNNTLSVSVQTIMQWSFGKS